MPLLNAAGMSNERGWREVVQEDCQARKLTGRMPWIVVDGGSRKRMIDDHDRCEWVNISLVPAHPGSP